MKNALIIGGTGPTGPYIIDGLLKRGYEVKLFHTGNHEADLPHDVEHIHGDPHFKETLERALGQRTFDLVVATYGRLRFIAQVMSGRVSRFISVGGGAFYQVLVSPDPDNVIPIPIPENAPLQTDPDLDKFTYRGVEAEEAVMAAHQSGYYVATHLRYPQIYGPRQAAPREWSIIRRILDGRRKLILADGGLAIASRGYAENLAHAILLAVDKPRESAGQIYNVRDETLLTARHWINAISRVMNHQFEYIDMPYSLARPARSYCGPSRHHVLDIAKIKVELGYQDVVPLETAMERTVRWYIENPPKTGPELEKLLRDPFDYAIEDRLIEKFQEGWQHLRDIQPPAMGFYHSHAHPRNPGESSKN